MCSEPAEEMGCRGMKVKRRGEEDGEMELKGRRGGADGGRKQSRGFIRGGEFNGTAGK